MERGSSALLHGSQNLYWEHWRKFRQVACYRATTNRDTQKPYYRIYSTFTSRRYRHTEKNRCMVTRIYPRTSHLLLYIYTDHLYVTGMKWLSSHTILLTSWGQDVADRGVVLPIDLKWTFHIRRQNGKIKYQGATRNPYLYSFKNTLTHVMHQHKISRTNLKQFNQ